MTEGYMWQVMDSCNGEIRVMAGRYGGGWLAAGSAWKEWDFDEQWSDLVGGDNDYFNARDFFNAEEGVELIEHAESPRDAFNRCVAALVERMEGE